MLNYCLHCSDNCHYCPKNAIKHVCGPVKLEAFSSIEPNRNLALQKPEPYPTHRNKQAAKRGFADILAFTAMNAFRKSCGSRGSPPAACRATVPLKVHKALANSGQICRAVQVRFGYGECARTGQKIDSSLQNATRNSRKRDSCTSIRRVQTVVTSFCGPVPGTINQRTRDITRGSFRGVDRRSLFDFVCATFSRARRPH